MNTPSLPELIDEALRLSHRLEALTDETYRAARRLAEASDAFELSEAKAWVEVRHSMGSVDENGAKRFTKDYESEVRLRIAAEARALLNAKTEDKALDNASRNLRQQLSATQSIASALKEELRLAGGPS